MIAQVGTPKARSGEIAPAERIEILQASVELPLVHSYKIGERERKMNRLLSLLLVTLMVVVTSCGLSNMKVSIDEDSILQPNGDIRVTDFDDRDTTSFFRSTEEIKDYHIVIETEGGSCSNAVAMVNRIEELQAKGATITTETYGHAWSAGSYLFLAGDKRIVHSGATFLFHGCGGGRTTRTDQESIIREHLDSPTYMEFWEMFNSVDQQFIEMLRKTDMTDKDIANWMFHGDNNFMNWTDAVAYRVATDWYGDLNYKPLKLRKTSVVDPRYPQRDGEETEDRQGDMTLITPEPLPEVEEIVEERRTGPK